MDVFSSKDDDVNGDTLKNAIQRIKEGLLPQEGLEKTLAAIVVDAARINTTTESLKTQFEASLLDQQRSDSLAQVYEQEKAFIRRELGAMRIQRPQLVGVRCQVENVIVSNGITLSRSRRQVLYRIQLTFHDNSTQTFTCDLAGLYMFLGSVREAVQSVDT